MPLYNSINYWNSRYYDEIDYFDWYCNYEDIKDEIKSILKRLSVTFSAFIIEMIDFGCGSSLISENIIKQCPKAKILAIDGSADCIKFMNYNNKETNIEYQCRKIESISTSKNSLNRGRYHLILDKGTTDSILCGINKEVKSKNIINGNIYNLLSLNGIYLLISHNPNRYRLFAKSKWAIHRKQVKIPYFGPKQSIHYKLTNDIKKYLDENNRILSNYKPFQQVDESQKYLQSIMEHKKEKEEKKQEKEKEKPEPRVIEKPVFNLEKKTAEQLLEERRKRRLEYEATLNKAKEESERFRKEWEEKQRLKREEQKRKEEEEKNKKIVIRVDDILKKKDEKNKTKDESEESDSYGGYMTDSSEEDSEKEKERIAAIAKLIEDCDDEKQKKAKKKKKKKNKTGNGVKKQEMKNYDENMTIYQKFRSKYTLLVDVEQNYEPFCFSDPNGRNQAMMEKYQQLMINEFYRQREEKHETTKIIYLYTATKIFNKNSK